MPRQSRTVDAVLAIAIAALLATAVGVTPTIAPAAAASSTVVISQVYGGGGNTGATLKNDFIELYNRGSTAVNVTGWTVQYASSSGSSWDSTVLSGTIASHAYYLIKEGAGAGGTVELPTPNATGAIAMSATSGKVALRNSSTLLSGSCPGGLVDFVGYGTSANCHEGSNPTATLSNTTAALRKSSGATDTDDNGADFTVGTPNPRHSVPSDKAPTVKSTVPAAGTKNVALNANLTVTFSEKVTASVSSFTISCSRSGAHPAAVSGGPTTFTLNPTTNFVNRDACTLVVLAAKVRDVDTVDPPDAMAANKSVAFSVSTDQTGPTAKAPSAALRSGVALSGTGLRVRLTWSGSDGTGGTGVAGYELARSVNGGTWTMVSSALVTSASDVVASSGTVQYRVRGIDKVGNRGAWAYGPPLGPRLVQQSATAITYGGTWTTRSATAFSGGSAKSATAIGASATYTLKGLSIALVTTKAPSRGAVKVYVDGVLATTVDTYAATTTYRAQAWSRTFPTSGSHTVKLVVVGTAGRARVDLDALAVLLPSTTGTVTATPLALLGGLATAAEQPTGYDRSLFVHWIDADGDGCDTRDEVLIAESLTKVTVGSGCALSGGSWSSAYDGAKTSDPSTFHIDHVVALSEAWDSGAYGWTAERRKAYANDLADARALRAVSASSNTSKSDRDPAEWLPPLASFRCTYATEWVTVKVRWRLTVDSTERSALQSLLGSCPASQVTVVIQ